MRVPMAPSKFMSVWKHPNIRTTPFRWLFCGASMMISAAFQYKGWSKVTMVGRLCFMARLQIKSNIDTMQDLSPEYILIIGKNLTDDSPGCWLRWCKICIIPCQFGVASLKLRETSHRISILMSLSRNLTTSWQACIANLYSKIGISIFSTDIGLRGMRWFVCFPGVTEAMTPIPWNVPLSSIVMMLWSTLSAAKRTDISSKSTSPPRTSGSTRSAAFCKYDHFRVRWTEYLSILWSTMIFERYRWWICTASPICSGAMTARVRAAWIMAWPTAATLCLVSFPTNNVSSRNANWKYPVDLLDDVPFSFLMVLMCSLPPKTWT